MGHRIGMAIICLHLSALLYLLAGVALLLVSSVDEFGMRFSGGVIFLLICLALMIGIEIIVYGLKHRKFWAWIAGLCAFGLYLPSLFFPLGALGLWGLLDAGSRREFGINVGSMPRIVD